MSLQPDWVNRQPVPHQDHRPYAWLHRGRGSCGHRVASGSHHLLLQQVRGAGSLPNACHLSTGSRLVQCMDFVLSDAESAASGGHGTAMQLLSLRVVYRRPMADNLFSRPVAMWNAVAAAIPI